MTLEQAIYNKLKNYPPLASLVAGRIYPMTYPQGSVLPAVVYQRTSKISDYSHDGEAGSSESRYQISSFADTYSQAKQTALEVKKALEPWMAQQEVIDSTLLIGGVFLENEFDVYGPEEVEQTSAYHVLADYF